MACDVDTICCGIIESLPHFDFFISQLFAVEHKYRASKSKQQVRMSPEPGRSWKLTQVLRVTLVHSRRVVIFPVLPWPRPWNCLFRTVYVSCGTRVLENWQLAILPRSEHCEFNPRIEKDSIAAPLWLLLLSLYQNIKINTTNIFNSLWICTCLYINE